MVKKLEFEFSYFELTQPNVYRFSSNNYHIQFCPDSLKKFLTEAATNKKIRREAEQVSRPVIGPGPQYSTADWCTVLVTSFSSTWINIEEVLMKWIH